MTGSGVATDQLETLRGLVTGATQRLLGDTIAVAEQAWREPSRLPGWTRGHVATHIARQADGIVRLTEWARTGVRHDMYVSAEQREADIEAGSGRSGLDLQIDLDTAAGRLGDAFELLDHDEAWDAVVELRGGLRVPARLLPLTRLLEVVIHHVDLDIGYEIHDIEQPTAEWLLEWCAFRLRQPRRLPPARPHLGLRPPDRGGSAGEPIPISGSSANLLGWLMSRVDSLAVRGDEGLKLPAVLGGLDDRSQPCLARGRSTGRPVVGDGVDDQDQRRPDGQQRLPAAGPDGATVLIDAANDEDRLLKIITGGRVDTIVTTHRHGDHWQALPAVAAATSAQLVSGRPDVDAIATGAGVEDLVGVWDGDRIELGAESLEVIGLVGHTPGSITLAYAGDGTTHLFTGDSLFPGGAGRTTNPEDFTR